MLTPFKDAALFKQGVKKPTRKSRAKPKGPVLQYPQRPCRSGGILLLSSDASHAIMQKDYEGRLCDFHRQVFGEDSAAPWAAAVRALESCTSLTMEVLEASVEAEFDGYRMLGEVILETPFKSHAVYIVKLPASIPMEAVSLAGGQAAQQSSLTWLDLRGKPIWTYREGMCPGYLYSVGGNKQSGIPRIQSIIGRLQKSYCIDGPAASPSKGPSKDGGGDHNDTAGCEGNGGCDKEEEDDISFDDMDLDDIDFEDNGDD